MDGTRVEHEEKVGLKSKQYKSDIKSVMWNQDLLVHQSPMALLKYDHH